LRDQDEGDASVPSPRIIHPRPYGKTPWLPYAGCPWDNRLESHLLWPRANAMEGNLFLHEKGRRIAAQS